MEPQRLLSSQGKFFCEHLDVFAFDQSDRRTLAELAIQKHYANLRPQKSVTSLLLIIKAATQRTIIHGYSFRILLLFSS
jgi:hypothetical protein